MTGRLGWAWGPWLFYGKGGLAVLDAKTNVSDFGRRYTGYRIAVMSTHIGWTAGGGIEYLLEPGLEREARVPVLRFRNVVFFAEHFCYDPPCWAIACGQLQS